MKKVTQITKISYAILLAVFIFSFNSCQKENCEPSNTSESTGDVSGAKRNNCNSQLYPVQSRVCGNTYAQWSAKWWKWAMEFPITGHPFVADPSFDVSQRQSGQVWFLAAPFGT